MCCKHCRRDAMKKRRRLLPEPIRPLTGDEAAKLLAAFEGEANQELKDAVTLVLNTGMRLGELRDLRWEDVNLAEKTICFRSTRSFDVRHVPFNGAVAEMLERRRSSMPLSEYVFQGASPLSRLLRESRQLKEAGNRVLGRDVTFHHLRHTFFLTLVNHGADIPTLMSIGGWRSPLMALKFMRVSPVQARAAYEAAMKVFGK